MSVDTELKTPERILKLLSANPELTIADIAQRLGKSVRAVERGTRKLAASGRLVHVGPKKGGHWVVRS
jgi:ATP-dependent DNA helicase RecG